MTMKLVFSLAILPLGAALMTQTASATSRATGRARKPATELRADSGRHAILSVRRAAKSSVPAASAVRFGRDGRYGL